MRMKKLLQNITLNYEDVIKKYKYFLMYEEVINKYKN